jgi:SPP1 family predicted phage head-tail adaptor
VIEAGKLNRRIQIQAQSTEQDAAGQPLGWTTVYSCWAAIDVVNSQLTYETAEFVSNVTHKITVRDPRSVSISAANRVVYGAHTYEVKAVLNPGQRNEELQLICYEIGASE